MVYTLVNEQETLKRRLVGLVSNRLNINRISVLSGYTKSSKCYKYPFLIWSSLQYIQYIFINILKSFLFKAVSWK